jgi:predicted Zn-dependent protease
MLACMAFLLAGCATNPVTGKREFTLVSSEQELAMGREGHAAVMSEFGVCDDPALQAYVDSIGQALARVSHLPALQWHFTVLDDPLVNAFALPGGYIYVTRGILAHMNSEAQLAGVLGHEIGHVTARHSAQRATQQQLTGLGVSLAGIFSGSFQRYSREAQQALGLLLLKFSRDQENESDRLGVDYAVKAGWDPREIPGTYRTLRRHSERAGQQPLGFLSTHPDPGDREVRTRELANEAAAGRSGLRVEGRSFLRRIEGVTFGVDPRHGYFEGTHFYHPQLDFEMVFPKGWQTRNTRAAVLAASPNERALMQLSLVDAKNASPEAYVRSLLADGRVSDARGGSEAIHGAPAWVGRLTVRTDDGNEGTLLAAYVRRGEHMFQIVGRTAVVGAEDEQTVLASIRTLGSIRDALNRDRKPDRVMLASAPAAGSLSDQLAKMGPHAIEAEDCGVLNDLELDETVLKGQILKVVRPSGRR